MSFIHPVDGEFEERAAACEAAGHPKMLINLGVSGKVGREVRQCLCGIGDEAPAALKAFRKARRRAAGKLQTQDK